jgi:RNA polymerase sigma factor for flagellar operon FliA
LSLDDALPNSHGGQSSLADIATDSHATNGQEQVEEHEVKSLMVRCLKLLPEQEKLVIALYYYEELTLKEIGEILGLTESRVSQIHSKAMLKMRTSLRLQLNR